jgi:membrane fusion protein, multidrug efflux system
LNAKTSAKTDGRGSLAETPWPAAERPEQSPADKDGKTGERPQDAGGTPRDKLREHWRLVTIAACLVLVALIGGTAYWLKIRNFETTDDAFIAARSFSVAPKVGGYVTEVPVTDDQHVKAGDLLARIDDRDYKNAVDQAQAQVAVAEANIGNVQAQIDGQHQQVDQAKAQLDQAQAQQTFAEQEETRTSNLVPRGADTVQHEQQNRSNLQSAQANTSRSKAAVIAAELGIKTLEAQLRSARASLQQAQAQLDQAKLNLQYTSLTASQSGRVVRLTGAVGTFATAGQSLMMFVPDEVWIVANYKETQLSDMRPGQAVVVRIDAYPNRKLSGHVDSVQPGSGTAFSLLPAENATGNFVKVVQRVPVKLVIDNWPADLPVGPGMSVVPWVKVR